MNQVLTLRALYHLGYGPRHQSGKKLAREKARSIALVRRKILTPDWIHYLATAAIASVAGITSSQNAKSSLYRAILESILSLKM
jgi:hypothetical protein